MIFWKRNLIHDLTLKDAAEQQINSEYENDNFEKFCETPKPSQKRKTKPFQNTI